MWGMSEKWADISQAYSHTGGHLKSSRAGGDEEQDLLNRVVGNSLLFSGLRLILLDQRIFQDWFASDEDWARARLYPFGNRVIDAYLAYIWGG